MAYIEFKDVNKIYKTSKMELKVLNNVNFKIEKGEIIVITGPSKSGKTTCLNILSGMDNLLSGSVFFDGTKINDLNSRKLTKYRRENIGFIFKEDNLLKNLTVKENIEISTDVCKDKLNIDSLMKKMNLYKKKDNLPCELSNFDKKKVSVLRAIAKKPKLLLCDETTNGFDRKEKKQMLNLIKDIAKKEKMTVIIATKDNSILPIANKIIKIKNGNIMSVKVNKKPASVGELKW